MQTQTNTQIHQAVSRPILSLRDKAMLVRLKRGSVAASKKDKNATAIVEANVGRVNIGNFNKPLLKESANLKRVQQAMYAVYKYHIDNTLPWLDDGLRMLKQTKYLDYTQEVRNLRQEVETSIAALQSSWPYDISADQHRLGPLFNPSDYPDPARLPELFYVDVAVMPIPDAGDFRFGISEEDKRKLQESIREAEDRAAQHVIEEMLEPLTRMADKLRVPIGQDGAVFRNTLTENVLAAAERMEQLNISDDPAIASAIQRVKQLGKQAVHSTDMLRSNPTARSTAAQEVDNVLKDLIGLL